MKKRQRPTEAAILPYLQQELIEEILSRLPPKTLMTFKTVSKSWNNLICETRFHNMHLKQSMIHHNRINIMNFNDWDRALVYDAATTGRSVDADDPDNERVNFMAYCNGLFCISFAEDIFLWNPSTKRTRKISSSEIELPTQPCTRAHVFFGLGNHPSSDDYKLVRISVFNSVDFHTEVKIYSRNTGAWRRMQDFPYDYPFALPGVFINGCLHWIVSMWDREVDVREHKVAALDLADERFSLIPLPEFRLRGVINLGSLDEKLVVFSICYNGTSDIWILKEHGRAESWTRIKITTDCVSNSEAFCFFEPLCILRPGHILLRLGPKKLVSFDVEKKRLSDIHAPLMLEGRMVSFVETLVSPNACT